MLSYALAIAVAISSLVLFSTAFLMSGIHRKDDFLWSAVGLFYALVLWYCVRNITGAVLLGQAAATVLIVSYSWQTIKLRQGMQRVMGGLSPEQSTPEAIANSAQTNETNNFSVVGSINGLLKRRKPQVMPSSTPVTKKPTPKVTERDIAIPETPTEISEETTKKAQAQDTNLPVANEQVNVPDAKPFIEVAEKTTPGSKEDPDNQVSKPVETEPLPLPNKLPEVAQTTETESMENEIATNNVPSSQFVPENSKPELEPELKTENLSQEASNEEQDSTPAKQVEPTPEIIPTETAKSTKPKSALDSLETVEVAEVLEAESDRQSNNREPDRFNIIEVTTTEINVTTEVIKTDQHQDSDSDERS
jgi:hypothetical protein